jgi:hypothetical protein
VYKSSSRLIRLLSSFISRFRGFALVFLLIVGNLVVEGDLVALHEVVSSGNKGVSVVDIEGEVFVLSPTRVEVASVSYRSSCSEEYCDSISGDAEVLALDTTVINAYNLQAGWHCLPWRHSAAILQMFV